MIKLLVLFVAVVIIAGLAGLGYGIALYAPRVRDYLQEQWYKRSYLGRKREELAFVRSELKKTEDVLDQPHMTMDNPNRVRWFNLNEYWRAREVTLDYEISDYLVEKAEERMLDEA